MFIIFIVVYPGYSLWFTPDCAKLPPQAPATEEPDARIASRALLGGAGGMSTLSPHEIKTHFGSVCVA
jgi:hypothetical protein